MTDKGTATIPVLLESDDLTLWELTPPDQEFVIAIVQGKSQKAAYQIGHPDAKDTTAYVEGSRKVRRPKIQQAIAELNAARMYRLQVALKAIAEPALRNVSKAVEQGDVGVSLDVLNRVGLNPKMVAELELSAKRSNGVSEMAGWD